MYSIILDGREIRSESPMMVATAPGQYYRTTVIVVRHPDYSNDHIVIDGVLPGVVTIDVDLGSMCPHEYDREWASGVYWENHDHLSLEARKRLLTILRDNIDAAA